MARMKFLCDDERCIECNACVTACKNEHEIPWGINRRRVVTIDDGQPGEKSISVACMHCTDAPPFAQSIAFTPLKMALSYMTKTFASAVAIVFMLVLLVLRNFHKTVSLVHAGKWINVLFVQAALNPIIVTLNLITMVATDCLKENSPYALKCARPKPY